MIIGVFDSGVGGLGIYEEIKKLLPKESIIYLADEANCPYGEKSITEIKKISLKNVEFLKNKGANIIVIACNTASTLALNYVRENVTEVLIVGVVPVIKTAAKVTKNKKIGILATKRTVESEYLRDLIEEFAPENKGYTIFYQGANELVEVVENGCHSEPDIYRGKNLYLMRSFTNVQDDIKKYLQVFIDNNVDVIALSCTHFPFIKQQIQDIVGKNVEILDSNAAVARQVARIVSSITYHVSSIKPRYRFYTIGDSKKVTKIAQKLLNDKNIEFEKI